MQQSAAGNNTNNEKAVEILETIFNSWTSVSEVDGVEYRSPASWKQIRKSNKLLKEARALNPDEPEVMERIQEIEGVLEDAKNAIPRYRKKVIVSLVLSFIFLGGFIYFLKFSDARVDGPDYDPEMWTAVRNSYITPESFIEPEDMGNVGVKTYVSAGTQVRPLATMGSKWIQVELPDAQRGFIYARHLKGYKNVEANREAVVTSRRGEKEGDTLQPGQEAVILEYFTDKSRSIYIDYIKIQLPDGRIRWAREYEFDRPFMEDLPKIAQLFNYQTTMDVLNNKALGKPLEKVEKRYGPATAIISTNGELLAYFRQIVVVKDRKHYDDVLIMNVNSDTMVEGFKLPEKTETHFYDRFPLLNSVRKLEPSRTQIGTLISKDDSGYMQWWQNFKDIHWTTRILGWIIGIIVGIIIFLLFFSIPRLVINPLFQLFMFTKFLGNWQVKLVNFLIYLAASYFFFLYMTIIMDQWLIPAIGTVLTFVFWWRMYSTKITYNRCPSCNTMYSAIDEGSTFTGRTKHVTWGTYDVYKGTKETSTTRTKMYERRDKKEVELVDHYLEHRTCSVCGYKWDIQSEETAKKYTKHY